MGDIMSILQSSYSAATASQSLISPGDKFAAVDPTKYQGTWTGKDLQISRSRLRFRRSAATAPT